MRQLITIILILSTQLSFASETPAIAASCMGCHGEGGRSNNSLWPNLAGQKRDYFLKQLKAFKTGERKDPMMNPLMKSLSDSDLETLADYFSNLKATP